MKTIITIKGAMSLKQIAKKYGCSGKTLNKRLKKAKIDFEGRRTLFPAEICLILEKLGPWEMTYDET